jgi:leader peptidase (prepilin peptidase)/N-methyltransferase
MNITLIIPLILGWLAGLLINYLSDVLPITRRLSVPACRNCGSAYSWTDYLTLRSCRSCGKGRSLRTWLVQILAVAAFLYFWMYPSQRLGPVMTLLVLVYFGIVMVIDLEHRLILYVTSLAGAILGLIVGTYIYSKEYSLLVSLGQSLLGGVVGFGIMFLLYKFGELVARYRSRKLVAAGKADDEEEALGGGDVYLSGVLGLMMGWPVVLALIYGALLGGIVSLILIVALLIRRRFSSEALMTFIPYGPFLIIGAFYVLFFL